MSHPNNMKSQAQSCSKCAAILLSWGYWGKMGERTELRKGCKILEAKVLKWMNNPVLKLKV